jgi:hypothetical protein
MDTLFFEHPDPGYPARTRYNIIHSDYTVAIAVDFNTAGERLTKRTAVDQMRKPFLQIDLNYLVVDTFMEQNVQKLVDLMMKDDCPYRILNVAGNGIYSLRAEQIAFDNIMTKFFTMLLKQLPEGKLFEVISGGQTGVDEAAIKGAKANGLFTRVNAPNGWMFRNKHSRDIKNEQLFKQRFL